MKKPAECKGCPFYDGGKGAFVPPQINQKAEVHVYLPVPTDDKAVAEVKADTTKVGIREISVSYAIKCRGPFAARKPLPWWLEVVDYKAAGVKQAIAHCAAHDRVGPMEAIQVYMDDIGMVKAGMQDTVYDWRGHLLPNLD